MSTATERVNRSLPFLISRRPIVAPDPNRGEASTFNMGGVRLDKWTTWVTWRINKEPNAPGQLDRTVENGFGFLRNGRLIRLGIIDFRKTLERVSTATGIEGVSFEDVRIGPLCRVHGLAQLGASFVQDKKRGIEPKPWSVNATLNLTDPKSPDIEDPSLLNHHIQFSKGSNPQDPPCRYGTQRVQLRTDREGDIHELITVIFPKGSPNSPIDVTEEQYPVVQGNRHRVGTVGGGNFELTPGSKDIASQYLEFVHGIDPVANPRPGGMKLMYSLNTVVRTNYRDGRVELTPGKLPVMDFPSFKLKAEALGIPTEGFDPEKGVIYFMLIQELIIDGRQFFGGPFTVGDRWIYHWLVPANAVLDNISKPGTARASLLYR